MDNSSPVCHLAVEFTHLTMAALLDSHILTLPPSRVRMQAKYQMSMEREFMSLWKVRQLET